jgi:predicted phosphate transport protein (TIGR00153 family)
MNQRRSLSENAPSLAAQAEAQEPAQGAGRERGVGGVPNRTRAFPQSREPRFWRNLLMRLRLRDRRFYPLFDLHAQLCTGAVEALLQLLSDLKDPNGRVREIEALEKRADAIVHDVHAAVRRTLFPPHPRSAIVDLINHMDDILDLTEDAAETVHLYHVTSVTPEALRLAKLALESVRHIQTAVAMLAEPARNRELLALCAQIDDLEAQADHVLRAAMSKLFRDEPDVRELIKLRAVYEVLEELTDVCKDVSAELEAIVLGHLGS